MREKVTSAGFIIYKREKTQWVYLILHYTHGHWDFPKGKLEQGETLHQAAHRELREETGLSTSLIPDFACSFSYIFKEVDGKKKQKDVTLFLGEVTQEPLILSPEHQNYQWLPYHLAFEKLTFENAREALTSAEKFLSNRSS